MASTSSLINKKGMVTIPSKLRKKYNLHEGSEVAFVEIEGSIVLVPILELEEMRKYLPTLKQMEKNIDEASEIELKLEHEDD
jgi:AbrB family looped-hinge helix DNA binding protein